MSIALAGLVAMALGVSGCFTPEFQNVQCGPLGDCPPGHFCGPDGICEKGSDPGVADANTGADANTNADASLPDSGVFDEPDANTSPFACDLVSQTGCKASQRCTVVAQNVTENPFTVIEPEIQCNEAGPGGNEDPCTWTDVATQFEDNCGRGLMCASNTDACRPYCDMDDASDCAAAGGNCIKPASGALDGFGAVGLCVPDGG